MRSLLKFGIVAVLMAAVSSASLQGQSKKETKQFQKAVKTGTVAGYEKFLSKFPDSFYQNKVTHLIDSIHFGAVDQSDIVSCLAYASAYPASEFSQQALQRGFDMVIEQRYIQDNDLSQCRMVRPFEKHYFAGNDYYLYEYENVPQSYNGELKPGMECEYVAALVDVKSGVSHSAMFSGKVIPADKGEGYMIEGEFIDAGSDSFTSVETRYLVEMLKKVEILLPIPEGDLLTDQAIEWWLKNNSPKAKSLKFGILPSNCSIVDAFNKRDDAVVKGGYKVNFFDIRGYTVLVSYQKKSAEYSLVNVEPVCKDEKRDPLLSNIYFESSNSLVLYYYKGKTTYKVRVNLANKSVTR